MANLEDYLEISTDAITLKGHRIGLEQIVYAYREGATAEDIARDFPGLPLETIYAALTYYLRNQSEVDSYVATCEAAAEQAYGAWAKNPPPVIRRLRVDRNRASTSKP